jgi:hypothetical protein
MPNACPVGDRSCGEWVYSWNDFGDRPVWMTHADAKSFRGESGGRRNLRVTKKSRRVGRKSRKTRRSRN